LFGYFDKSAEAVVQALHHADAAGNAADIERMRAFVRCDLKRVYRRDDSVDTAHWLAVELGISRWKAARWLHAGYKLDELPVLRGAYERGELSTDKFVEVARFATSGNEAALLAWAKRTSPAGIRARADRELRAATEEVQMAEKDRALNWDWDEGNTRLSLWGSLPADQGAKFVQAVDRLATRLPSSPEDEPTQDATRADALMAMASASIANDQSADNATLVVHADVDTILDEDKNGILCGGLPLPPQATAMLSCDSRVQTVLHDEKGEIFHVASPSYIVPKWLRRQVEHRDDYRCTFPNCGRRAFTDVHHIVPWPRGRTELSNLILVCHTHHRLLHIHEWHVRLAKDGTTRWFRPDWAPYKPGPAHLKRSVGDGSRVLPAR
jgi:hypothetical protein